MRFYYSRYCWKYGLTMVILASLSTIMVNHSFANPQSVANSQSIANTQSVANTQAVANTQSKIFILEDGLTKQEITQYLDYYIDDTNKDNKNKRDTNKRDTNTKYSNNRLDIKTIASEQFSSSFKPLEGKSSFGYSPLSYWFRLTVENKTNHPIEWFIEYPYAVMDKFIFYKPIDNENGKEQLFSVIKSGDKYPFSERPVNFRTTIIPITQNPGQTTFYFNLISDGSIVVPLLAWGKKRFESHVNSDSAVNWLYYGVMLAAILYNFFIFLSVREWTYLYLIVFIIGVSLFTMTHNGLSFQYLWPNSIWWANACHPFSGFLTWIGAIMFTISFLSTKVTLPRLHIFLTIMVFCDILMLLTSFIVPYHIASQSMVIFTAISVLSMLSSGLILSFKGQRQAKFYVLAWLSMLISSLVLALKAFGFLESNVWTDSGVQMSIALFVTILSFGLVDKINTMKQERQKALEEKQNALEEKQKAFEEKEMALKMVSASEKQYRLLANSVKEVIWTLDLKTLKLNYITPSIFQMTGYTAEEAKSNFSFKKMLSPDSAKKTMEAIKMATTINKTATTINKTATTINKTATAINENKRQNFEEMPQIEAEFYTKSGDVIWVETNLTFLRDEDAKPFEMLGVTRDITQRRRTEKENKKLEDKLIQSNKLEAIGNLAGGISHDMNNILTAIMGYVEISLSDVPENSKIRTRLDRVINACYRARDLVKQILTFSRQDSQENIPVNINLMIKEVLKLIRASLPATIKIQQNIPNDKYIIIADPTKIHQIIMNLCSNAGYAMQEHGGLLAVCTELMELDPDSAGKYIDLKPGTYIRMTVSDTGQGMDKQIKERIFEPFFTTKPRGQGTGMGLAMVHGIVKSLDGNIYVYSEVGKGTTFHLFFPKAPEGSQIGNIESLAIVTGNETILYVDDEATIVDMAQEMLTTLGYRVEGVVGSMEAFERFQQNPDRFDIVITDQTMPDMTGCELAKKIWEIRSGIPIILCSGFNTLVNPESSKSIGISEYVMKPYSKQEISIKIRRALCGE
ncbi:MAG: response regulator [Desulfamplus sp.]|nr:response regulator [Desulfamplus sp.]